MQIKTTMRNHLTPVKMAINKLTDKWWQNVEKREPTVWENIFAKDTLDRGLISKIYKELIPLNARKQTTQLKNGQRTWIDTSPKRTYRWPIDIWKDAQCHQPLDKCKLKPQWDITLHLLEWPSLINQQTTSANKDVEKRLP